MKSISLCLIAKNEEEVIGRCIESVIDVIDEIIVVDTGSTDKTIEIAEKYGAKVYNFTWIDDFAAARNYSFSKATKEYIFWLDADDILFPGDKEKFKELKEGLDGTVDAVSMNYVLAVDENNNPASSLRRNRLVKRSNNFLWIGKVHEYLEVYGNMISSNVSILHQKNKPYTDRNLRIYEGMLKNNNEFSPREQFYYANELFDHGRYDEALDMYRKFVDGKKGWVEDVKSALSKIADCYSHKGDKDMEMKALLEALEYDIPRSDFCCRIAYRFIEQNRYKEAIFWYKAAIDTKPDEDNMALIDHAYYTWIPYIQLCVCYANLGDFNTSNYYNEKAAEYIPDHPSVLQNREYLKDKINK